jgi:excisionase family DNA binding protein
MDTRNNENATMEMKYVESKLPARLLAVDEVAHFLGVHSSTVRRWERMGLLKSYPIGPRNNLRFKQEDILNFLDKNAKRREVS